MFTTTLEWRLFSEQEPEKYVPILVCELGTPWGDPPKAAVNIHREIYYYEKDSKQLVSYRNGQPVKERLSRLYWAYMLYVHDDVDAALKPEV